jgi:hypothetical protein
MNETTKSGLLLCAQKQKTKKKTPQSLPNMTLGFLCQESHILS